MSFEIHSKIGVLKIHSTTELLPYKFHPQKYLNTFSKTII